MYTVSLTRTRNHKHTQTHTQPQTHTDTHRHTRNHKHTQTQTHKHTDTDTHTQACLEVPTFNEANSRSAAEHAATLSPRASHCRWRIEAKVPLDVYYFIP